MPIDPDVDREIGRLDRRDDRFSERLTKIEDLAVAYQLKELRRELEALSGDLAHQREEEAKERRDVRVAIYALVGVICAALISGGAAVVAAGVG
jgi:glutamate synthase domain-containing protein 3